MLIKENYNMKTNNCQNHLLMAKITHGGFLCWRLIFAMKRQGGGAYFDGRKMSAFQPSKVVTHFSFYQI